MIIRIKTVLQLKYSINIIQGDVTLKQFILIQHNRIQHTAFYIFVKETLLKQDVPLVIMGQLKWQCYNASYLSRL